MAGSGLRVPGSGSFACLCELIEQLSITIADGGIARGRLASRPDTSLHVGLAPLC